MRAYWATFRLRILTNLQYRMAAVAGIATQFFWGLITIMVLEAFYAASLHPQPIHLEQAVAYVWLRQSFLLLVVLWIRDGEMSQAIVTGQVAYELARPYGLYEYWFAKGLAFRLAAAGLRFAPILLIASFLPAPYRLILPPDGGTALVFALSLGMSLLISTAITLIMHTTVFYTMSPAGSVALFGGINDFLAGGLVPLPLMPAWVQTLAYRLPFYATQDTPFRIYSGHLAGAAALQSLAAQLGWMLFLYGLGRYWLTQSLRRVTIQGG